MGIWGPDYFSRILKMVVTVAIASRHQKIPRYSRISPVNPATTLKK